MIFSILAVLATVLVLGIVAVAAACWIIYMWEDRRRRKEWRRQFERKIPTE